MFHVARFISALEQLDASTAKEGSVLCFWFSALYFMSQVIRHMSYCLYYVFVCIFSSACHCDLGQDLIVVTIIFNGLSAPLIQQLARKRARQASSCEKPK